MLSWNSNDDVDLHVVDPLGELIYYGNAQSVTGGELTRHDIDGEGPESIRWLNGAPQGPYTVRIVHFSGNTADTVCRISLEIGDPNRSFVYGLPHGGAR